MGSITGAKTDLINSLNDTTGIGDSLIIVSTSGSNNLYRIYQLADYSLPGDIIATIVDNNGLVIDTMDRTVGTYSDDGYMDIFSTISALARMPDGTINPFYPTSIPAANDSTKFNLLIVAMLDLSIAHNSPLPESNEQKQGIQTNYMQFMDNVAGNWATLRTATRGIVRLRAIHERVLAQNKGEIIDPVYVVNYGTSFEPHTVTQKRKNYALIEGFSRINWNCVVPNYGTALAGTGMLFRVSDNVELYRAFIKNSYPTFDTVSFLNGATARRLIVPANDTVISNFISKDGGVWVKGIPETEEIQYYTGIVPVRLPIAGVHNTLVKIDTAFTLTTETMGNGDPVGKLVDVERSVLGVYAISNQGNRADTLENIEEPGVLLHGQKRKLVYNTKYSTGDRVEFSVLTKGEDTGKVFIESKPTSNTAILADTSVTVSTWIALATVFVNGMVIQSIGSEGTTRRLGLKNVVNSNLEVWCDDIVALAMERNNDSLIEMEKRSELEIAIRTTNGVKLYTSSSKSQQITAELLNATVEGDKWVTSWDRYESVFLNQDSIYAAIEQGIAGECAIIAQWKNTKQEYATEKVTVLGVPKIESIEFTSDHEDADGNNLLHNAKLFFENEKPFPNPEWKNGMAKTYPISHMRNDSVDVLVCLHVPKCGTYRIVTSSTIDALKFDTMVYLTNDLQHKVPLNSKGVLPNYGTIIDDGQIDWEVNFIDAELNEKKISSLKTFTTIYVTYGEPLRVGSWNCYNSCITNEASTKRLQKTLEIIKNFHEENVDTVVKFIWNGIHAQLSMGVPPLVGFDDVWALWDVREFNIKPGQKGYVGGQCGEHAYLMENMLGVIGIRSEYMHVLPSKDTVRVNSKSSPIIDPSKLLIIRDWHTHSGDDSLRLCSSCPKIKINVLNESLLFLFTYLGETAWQKGEGSLYYSGKAYTLFSEQIIGIGNSQFSAAKSVMLQLENSNPDIDKPLQRWGVIFSYQNKERVKPCITMETVPLDSLVIP